MKIGPLGRMVEIPQPDSGMGFNREADFEVSELVGGGRMVERAPVTFGTFNMSWKGGRSGLSKNLQPLIDLYNGGISNGTDDALYMIDPGVKDDNILPPYWASAWQLAHVANGVFRPTVQTMTGDPKYPSRKVARFTLGTSQSPVMMSKLISINVPLSPGRLPYLKVWGTRTATSGIDVRLRTAVNGMWSSPVRYAPTTSTTAAPTAIMTALNAESDLYDAVKLSVALDASSELSLGHITLGYTNDTAASFPHGTGVGPLQFSSALQGTLDSQTIDRIGLSVDLTELRHVRSDLPEM